MMNHFPKIRQNKTKRKFQHQSNFPSRHTRGDGFHLKIVLDVLWIHSLERPFQIDAFPQGARNLGVRQLGPLRYVALVNRNPRSNQKGTRTAVSGAVFARAMITAASTPVYRNPLSDQGEPSYKNSRFERGAA
jgi:hypothetical protein